MRDDATSERLAAALGDDEAVAWTGRPVRGLRLRRIDALLVPFSLLWGGIVIYTATVAARTGQTLFAVVEVAFVVVALYLIAGRFAYDAYVRANLTYAVTNRAAYVVLAGPLARTLRYAPRALVPLELSLARDGNRGTIRFGPRAPFFGPGSRARGWEVWFPDLSEFAGVANAMQAYALLRDLVDGA